MVSTMEIAFSIIYLPIIFGIATFFLYNSIKTKSKNLYFITIYFYLLGLYYIFQMFGIEQNLYIVQAILRNIPFLFLILFTKYTFYREKKSAFPIILIMNCILYAIELIIGIPNGFSVPQVIVLSESLLPLYYVFEIIVIINSIMVDGWFIYAAYGNYRYLKNKDISPWLEKRHLIVSIAILCSAISTSLSLLIPPTGGAYVGSQLSLIIAIIKLPFVMIFYFGSLFGWIMPKFLKNYFNRNFKDSGKEEITEDEIIKQLGEG